MPKSKSLLQKTLDLLKKDRRKLPDIAAAAAVNYFWLRSFKNGTSRNPRILHVQALYDELSK